MFPILVPFSCLAFFISLGLFIVYYFGQRSINQYHKSETVKSIDIQDINKDIQYHFIADEEEFIRLVIINDMKPNVLNTIHRELS
jgi:hypothetical protein